ncbi:HEAT repeat-containing protein 6 [Tetrabaena socialis]|uniref:HEAT repeat-containing protein 6 n=1 Tax=Tetrabaena socialis TaxID=47790 RepID=A0A2J8AJJ2_9CHLO|nr:HEAT repeat-containing protein 6 [Tetrabaena socialis]|eukprot:PNH12673.1 HEAT repeat-containing protein 6 [Tetrabaena socialis]
MSWRTQARGTSAWRRVLEPLRQVRCNLVEDLSFLVQQLLGASSTIGTAAGSRVRDAPTHIALCRLLSSLTPARPLRLHAPAANLILGALRQWADAAADDATSHQPSTAALAAPSAPNLSIPAGAAPSPAPTDADAHPVSAAAAAPASTSLQLEALAALAALLPEHLGLLSEHERAAQLAALQSLLVPPPQAAQSAAQTRGSVADLLESQCIALATLAACCTRQLGPAPPGASASPADGSSTGAGLSVEEVGSFLAAAASLLQACALRSRPVEDAAHSRLYAALARAVQAAVAEGRAAWVPRAALLAEGLQRFLTYGVQATLAATTAAAAGAGAAQPAAAAAAGSPAPAAAAAPGGGGGNRYCPPHLRRRRESAADGAACSDSDMSDTEHSAPPSRSASTSGAAAPGLGLGSAGLGGGAVDRFRSSRVRLAALSCVQEMVKGDPRALQPHWAALLPLQSPLQLRPLTPHLLTVLLYDPLIKVRALAAATIASLLDGTAQRTILAVAEARSTTSRAPVRGFLTLSLSLGQLLLGAHAGLLHAVAHEGSALVLPGVLRALVVLMSATPYERLPPELLPEILTVRLGVCAGAGDGERVLRARWAALSDGAAASGPTSAAELGPIHAAYLACLAECFSTKQPSAGLAAHLQGPEGGAGRLVRELLELGQDGGAAAVLRIEALGALKGLAAHYTFALPQRVWRQLLATAAVGLGPTASAPTTPRGGGPASRTPPHGGPPSRTSSSSSLSNLGGPTSGPSRGASGRWGSSAAAAGPPQQQQEGQRGASASTSPEDKAAQLSVKVVSDYLAAVARQYGLDPSGGGGAAAAGGEMDGPAAGPGGGPPPSPGVVPLAAALPQQLRQQQQQLAALSPVSVASEEERDAGMAQLVGMWGEAVELLVPAATSHASYMVRSAGLACLGELPEPVFSGLALPLQQRLLALLSAAAGSDTVPAVRAAACKSLGLAAAFPAVLAASQLSGQVTRALLAGLRDPVLSVRIAASWAVANLCDAYRKRLEAAEAGGGPDGSGQGGWGEREQAGEQGGVGAPAALQSRWQSNAAASTSASSAAAAAAVASSPRASPSAAPAAAAALAAHHYAQLAALCGGAIVATQDVDKVRANGIRAVGNLLAALSPDMAAGLAGGSGGGGGGGRRAGADGGAAAAGGAGRGRGGFGAAEQGLRPQGSGWGRGRSPAAPAGGRPQAGTPAAAASGEPGGGAARGGGLDLEAWLDSALTYLQSALTTGNMKVQWNACYAALGLLRNAPLMAHPRVGGRAAPLLLLLVMLVRDSANYKIRTHAAAALAALPSREAYADVLPDALLVVAAALEALSGGGGGGANPAAAGGGGGGGNASGAPGARAAASSDKGGERDPDGEGGGGGGEGDGAEGRFPNYRYAAGLSAQLRATLVRLLSLSQPPDARRVREAMARRADFLHACLTEQLAEAVAPLRLLLAAGGAAGGGGLGGIVVLGGGGGGGDGGALELPPDPFGLSGSGSGRVASPHNGPGSRSLAALLEGLSLQADAGAASPAPALAAQDGCGSLPPSPRAKAPAPEGAAGDGAAAAAVARALGGSRPALTVEVHAAAAAIGADAGTECGRAWRRVSALLGALRGFSELLSQLGPACEPLLRDVQRALGQAASPRTPR